jgi:hypothetical protein
MHTLIDALKKLPSEYNLGEFKLPSTVAPYHFDISRVFE